MVSAVTELASGPAADGLDVPKATSELFDAAFYVLANGDVAVTESNALQHYWTRGRYEGRDPNALFDGAYYRAQLRGRKVEGDPLSDYLLRGANEGLRPHPLFDPGFYQSQLNVPPPPAELLSHYLNTGWRFGISPHPLFDPEYYSITEASGLPNTSPLVHYLTRDDYRFTPHYLFSDDVYTAAIESRAGRAGSQGLKGLAPLVHYVLFGWKLRVQTHPLFDPGYYAARHRKAVALHGRAHADPGLEQERDLLRHYIEEGWRLGISPTPYFDVGYYRSQRPDLDPDVDPLRQYLTPGGYAVSPHPGIDVEYYASEAGFVANDTPSILHLLATPAAARPSPHPAFDVTRYRTIYPDIADHPGGAILHFLAHGVEEDRSPNEWFSHDYVYNSFPQHDFGRESAVHRYLAGDMRGRPRIIFVSHDAGLTGAPGTILRIIQDFNRLYDIESYAIVGGGAGPRVPDFKRNAHTVLVHEPFYAASRDRLAEIARQLAALTEDNRPIAAIVNSAESRAMGAELARVGIPVITLVHESADLYPAGAFEPIVTASKKIVFGSQFVRDRAANHVDLNDDVAVVRGQGLQQDFIGTMNREQARAAVLKELGLEPDCFLVLGCGSVDYRKGADLFAAAAIDFLRKRPDAASRACFVWVGKGPGPHSIVESFVTSEIRSNRADGHIRFIGGRDDVEPYFVAADAFLMTSRVDPYPCVVQEAMAVGLPVIAFTEGGGTVEMIGSEAGFCVPLGDTAAMADKLALLVDDAGLRDALGRRGRRIVEERWKPEDYCSYLAGLVGEVGQGTLRTRGASASRNGMRKVFVLASDWQVAPPSEQAEELVRGLNSQGFDTELVLTRGRFTPSLSGGRVQRLPDVPFRFLQPANVAFENGRWRSSAQEIWRSLRDLCRLHHPCVVVALDDQLGAAIGAALPASVGVVAALQSGPGAVEEAYGMGPLLDRIIALSPSAAAQLGVRNPALAARTLVLPPASLRPRPTLAGETKRDAIFVRTDLADPIASRTILALRRAVAKLDPGMQILVHAMEPPQDASLDGLLRATGTPVESLLVGRPSSEIRAALGRSSVAVFLCRDASTSALVLDAAAAGAVPVVIDPDWDVSDLIKTAGLGVVLPTRSADAAVDSVVQLVARDDTRARFIAQAHAYLAENHESADALLAKLLDQVFEELAAKGSARPIAVGTPPLDAVPVSRSFAGSSMRIPAV